MKKISRMIAFAMLFIAVVFVVFALHHPQAGFPWSNTITYTIYIVYMAAMVILFIAPFKKK